VAASADRQIHLRDGLIVEDSLPFAAAAAAEQVHHG
jgi:hypothetical protein